MAGWTTHSTSVAQGSLLLDSHNFGNQTNGTSRRAHVDEQTKKQISPAAHVHFLRALHRYCPFKLPKLPHFKLPAQRSNVLPQTNSAHSESRRKTAQKQKPRTPTDRVSYEYETQEPRLCSQPCRQTPIPTKMSEGTNAWHNVLPFELGWSNAYQKVLTKTTTIRRDRSRSVLWLFLSRFKVNMCA